MRVPRLPQIFPLQEGKTPLRNSFQSNSRYPYIGVWLKHLYNNNILFVAVRTRRRGNDSLGTMQKTHKTYQGSLKERQFHWRQPNENKNQRSDLPSLRTCRFSSQKLADARALGLRCWKEQRIQGPRARLRQMNHKNTPTDPDWSSIVLSLSLSLCSLLVSLKHRSSLKARDSMSR